MPKADARGRRGANNGNGSEAVRPTTGLARKRLFSWLGEFLDNWTCVDLFAGSGSLGIEAYSRGATSIWLVDRSHKVIDNLRQTTRQLPQPPQASLPTDGDEPTLPSPFHIQKSQARHWLQQHKALDKVDLVMVDPPWGQQQLMLETLEMLKDWPPLQDGSQLYVEWRRQSETRQLADCLGADWKLAKQEASGDRCQCLFIKRQGQEQSQ